MIDGITNFIIKALDEATKFLIRDYLELEQLKKTSQKSIDNFITQSINRTEKILKKNLSCYPNSDTIFSKTFLPEEKEDILFYCIPIEGINNFLNTIPFFSTIIVAKPRNLNILKSCVIKFPMLGETYYSSYNQGAWIEKRYNNTTNRIKIYPNLHNNTILLDNIKSYFSKVIINEHPLHLNNIKIFGSIAYSLCLLAQNKANILIINKLNDIWKLIIQSFTEYGMLYKYNNDYCALFNSKTIKINFTN